MANYQNNLEIMKNNMIFKIPVFRGVKNTPAMNPFIKVSTNTGLVEMYYMWHNPIEFPRGQDGFDARHPFIAKPVHHTFAATATGKLS
jgi:hypothetical protein